MTELELGYGQHKELDQTWTVQHRYQGMTSYYMMHDRMKGQRFLYDLVEYILYGKVYNAPRLKPNATPFKIPAQEILKPNGDDHERNIQKKPKTKEE